MELNRKDCILFFMTVIILIIIINFLDEKLAYRLSNKYPQGFLTNFPVLNKKLTVFFKVITHLGEPDYIAMGMAPVFLYAKFKDDKELEILILKLVVVMFLSALVSSVLKVIFMRSRPYEGWNNWRFYFIISGLQKRIPFRGKYMSFPSGHTLISSSTYLFLILASKTKMMKVFLIILIILVAVSRVYLSFHWTSDIFISLVVGTFLVTKYKEKF